MLFYAASPIGVQIAMHRFMPIGNSKSKRLRQPHQKCVATATASPLQMLSYAALLTGVLIATDPCMLHDYLRKLLCVPTANAGPLLMPFYAAGRTGVQIAMHHSIAIRNMW